MSNIIKIHNLHKIFSNGPEELQIIRGLNLEVGKNSALIITGESGSGKSTLLNLISGLDYPTSGSIFVNGYKVNLLSENELSVYRSSSVGLVFQFHYLLNDFTALENVMLPLYMTGEDKSAAMEKAHKLLKEIGLKDRDTHYPQELSGGERQRVAVARALINEPEIILADEPTGNLDEKNSRIVEELLFSLTKNHNKTLILVTHDTKLAGHGERHMKLERGELLEV